MDELWRYSIRELRAIRREQVCALVIKALAGGAMSTTQLSAATGVEVLAMIELITGHPKINKQIRAGRKVNGHRMSVWYELSDTPGLVK